MKPLVLWRSFPRNHIARTLKRTPRPNYPKISNKELLMLLFTTQNPKGTKEIMKQIYIVTNDAYGNRHSNKKQTIREELMREVYFPLNAFEHRRLIHSRRRFFRLSRTSGAVPPGFSRATIPTVATTSVSRGSHLSSYSRLYGSTDPGFTKTRHCFEVHTNRFPQYSNRSWGLRALSWSRSLGSQAQAHRTWD